jgi:hypothetical protein
MTSSSLALWSPEQKQLIASTIAPGCSADELRMFAYACQRTGLDDGLRSIAERTGQLDGSETFWCGEDGEWKDVWLGSKSPAAAKTIIHRKGSQHPFVGVARYADYNAGQGLWNKMGAAMIAKCSEALALRKAFPADLSGVYGSEEMEQAEEIQAVTVTAEPAPAAPAGDEKVFNAGKAAIAKVTSIDGLKALQERMEKRSGELSDEQMTQLLELLMAKDKQLMQELNAAEEDPFADD